MRIIKFITSIDNYKNNLKINLLYILICLLFIYLSIPKSSYLFYYWPDFIYAEYFHNLNLEKKIFEVIPNLHNINGISSWIIEPKLNFLSNLNYNLTEKKDYFLYLFIFRLFEISTIIFLVKSINKKITLSDVVLILLIYSVLLVNFTRYDHESYISFPIIIFCLSIAIANYFKNNYIFFTIICIGNFWSFFVNPIFFFNVCFLQLIFFYSYFFLKKNYKRLFLLFLGNLPFTILFIFLSLGNSRFVLSDLYPVTDFHYNVSLFRSKNFLILTIIFLFLSFANIINNKKNSYFEKSFITVTFIQIFFGLIYLYKTESWMLPQPEYLEYSFQYILILIMFNVVKNKTNKIWTFCLISTLILIFNYRLIDYLNTYKNFAEPKNKLIFLNEKYGSEKKFFWQQEKESFFLYEDLKDKKVLLDIPNLGSKFHAAYSSGDLADMDKYLFDHYWYNNNFKGSFLNIFFWKSKITINEGYSHYLDINTVLSNFFNLSSSQYLNRKYNKKYNLNFTSRKILKRHEVPKIDYKNQLTNFYNFDYIFSDRLLNKNLIKKYNFKNFDLYLYENKSIKNNKIKIIQKINIINNYNNYENNLSRLESELFISKKNYSKIINIKKFCNVKNEHVNNEISFIINTDDNECIALFPIPFSNNNLFIEKDSLKNKKKSCLTFEVQYYFHGCILNKNSTYVLKKNNSLLYSIGSLKDALDYKEKLQSFSKIFIN